MGVELDGAGAGVALVIVGLGLSVVSGTATSGDGVLFGEGLTDAEVETRGDGVFLIVDDGDALLLAGVADVVMVAGEGETVVSSPLVLGDGLGVVWLGLGLGLGLGLDGSE